MRKKTLPVMQLAPYQTTLRLLHFGPYGSRVADTQDSALVVLRVWLSLFASRWRPKRKAVAASLILRAAHLYSDQEASYGNRKIERPF